MHGIIRKRKADGPKVRWANAFLLVEGKFAFYMAGALYLDVETVLEWQLMAGSTGTNIRRRWSPPVGRG